MAFAREALDQYLQAHNGVSRRAMDALNHVRSLTRPAASAPYKMKPPSRKEHLDIEEGLRKRGIELREYLIRPTRRRLRVSEWMGYDAKLGWHGVIPRCNPMPGCSSELMMAATFLLQGFGSIMPSRPDRRFPTWWPRWPRSAARS